MSSPMLAWARKKLQSSTKEKTESDNQKQVIVKSLMTTQTAQENQGVHPRIKALPPLPLDDHVQHSMALHREKIAQEIIEEHESPMQNAPRKELKTEFSHDDPIVNLSDSAKAPFFCVDGSQFNTARELGDALLVMNEDTFMHHVTSERNDFANWLEACFDEASRSFGSSLRGKTREQMVKQFVQQQRPPHEQHKSTAVYKQPEVGKHESKQTPVIREARDMSFELHPKPLPQSPLKVVHAQQVQHMLDLLRTINIQALTDLVAAKQAFIDVRTRVWRDFSEEDRKEVLGGLKQTYELLISHRN